MNASRVFVLLLALALTTAVLGAQDLRPTLETSTALSYGSVFELVLRDGTYDKPLSRLIWPIPVSASLEVATRFPWNAVTATTVALSGLAPLQVGRMIDEDWNAGDLDYGRSSHDGFLTAHWSARAEQSLSLAPFTLSAGGLYRWMTWEGWNGTGRYRLESGDVSKLTFSGLLIAYRQQWFIPYVGASYDWNLPGVTLSPQLRFSPFTWCNDMDNHKYASDDAVRQRDDKDFLDQTAGGLYLRGGLEAAFATGPQSTWGLRADAELTWGAIGDTVTTYSYQSTTGNTATYLTDKDSAGTWFRQANLTVFVRN